MLEPQKPRSMGSARSAWVLAVVLGGAIAASPAVAAPVVLYDGTADPVSQGWTHLLNDYFGGTATVTPGAGTTYFETTESVASQYQISTGSYGAFVVTMRARVDSSSWNSYDNGFGLSPFGSLTAFQDLSPGDRVNSIALRDDRIHWGDSDVAAALVDTSAYHDYSLLYDHGSLDVFIDASHADIVAGVASPVLSRMGVSPQGQSMLGFVGFGDMSNDLGVNSAFEVDFVSFDGLVPIPEPSSAALVALGLVAMARAACTARDS